MIETIDNRVQVLNPDFPNKRKYQHLDVYSLHNIVVLERIFPKDSQWVRIESLDEYKVSGSPWFENLTSQNSYSRKKILKSPLAMPEITGPKGIKLTMMFMDNHSN